MIYATEALENVYKNWIKLGEEKYPNEIQRINEDIVKLSLKGDRSIRLKNYTDERWPLELIRYYLAKGFEATDDINFGYFISW